MLYQQFFQANENPSDTIVSCFHYHGGEGNVYPIHCHAYYELSYIIQGSRYEYYNGVRHKVSTRSLFFLSPLSVHGIRNTSQVNDMVIQFSSSLLERTSISFHKKMNLVLCDEQQPDLIIEEGGELDQIICQLLALAHDPNFQTKSDIVLEWEQTSLLMRLITRLVRLHFLCVQDANTNPSEILGFNSIINQILSHPDEIPSMKDAAHSIGISYSNFSRSFKAATGFGYNEYCNLLRIKHAEDMLLNTSMTISAIAAAIGIDTSSYFTRLFKKKNGISPASYRKKYRIE